MADEKSLKDKGLIAKGNHLPHNPDNLAKTRELRSNMTMSEKKLWYDFLSGLNVRVLRQRPIDNYIVDFFCPSRKIVIEIDGDSHFVDDAEVEDVKRTQVLESYGLKVVRFRSDEVMRNFEGVCEALSEILA